MPGTSSAKQTWNAVPKALVAALGAGALVLALALTPSLRPQGGDTVPGRLGMATLACRGNQDLSDVAWVAGLVSRGTTVYFVRPAIEGRALVSTFGPGPAWLGWLAALGLEPGAPVRDDELRGRARVAAAAAVSVSTALLVIGASAVVPPLLAVALALAAALSFAGVATLGQGLWQQTASLPFLAGALSVTLWLDRLPKLLPAVALCAACAAWLRPADLPLLLFVTGAAVVRSVRAERSLATIAASLGAACAGAAPVLSWNLWYFDTPFSIAQWSANQRITEHVFSVSLRDIAMGLAGLLASPGRGIALFAPLVPLVVVLAVVRWRAVKSGGERAVAADVAFLAAGIAFQWLFAGTFFKWWGGAGFGPRLLAGAVWVAAAASALMLPNVDRGPRSLLVATAAFGALLGFLGLFRFDLAATEVALDAVHRPEAFFSLRAGPWTSLWPAREQTVRDAPPGPFIYCGERSLGPLP
jgi:hypothetical protein